MSAYPPEPWRLQGGLYGTLWSVPRALSPPPGCRPVRIGGRPLLVTGFAVYAPGGDLTYNELLSGWVVRRGLRLGLYIDQIWVDSEASMAGGRELWAIPKQMAVFDGLRVAGIAETAFTPRMGPTGRWPLSGWTMQPREDGLQQTRLGASGRLQLARARWRFDPDGPLAFLSSARQLASGALEPMRIVFGG